MRVLLLTPYAPDLSQPHAAADTIARLVPRLAEKTDLFVYSPQHRSATAAASAGERNYTLVESTVQAGPGRLDRFGRRPGWLRQAWPLRATREAVELISRLRPDVVHAEYLQSAEALADRRNSVLGLHDITENVMRESYRAAAGGVERAYRLAEAASYQPVRTGGDSPRRRGPDPRRRRLRGRVPVQPERGPRPSRCRPRLGVLGAADGPPAAAAGLRGGDVATGERARGAAPGTGGDADRLADPARRRAQDRRGAAATGRARPRRPGQPVRRHRHRAGPPHGNVGRARGCRAVDRRRRGVDEGGARDGPGLPGDHVTRTGGVGPGDATNLFVASTPEQIAAAVATAVGSPDEAVARGHRARAHIARLFRWDDTVLRYLDAYEIASAR